jgi:hypothetical protein
MADDDLDRILSGEPNIVPSSSFVPNVMVAVHREASIPAPLPFPWLQVAPGLAIGAGALIALFIIVIMRFGGSGAVVAGPMPHLFVAILEEANSIGLAWIALALVASFVPMRLVVAR